MIRGFIFTVGVLIGLALAVFSQARISHLRSLAQLGGVDLPSWSQTLNAESTLLQGQLDNAANPQVLPDFPAGVVSWKFHKLAGDGVWFRVALTGESAVQGDMLLPFAARQLSVENLQGSLTLAQLLDLLQVSFPGVQGGLLIKQLTLKWRPKGTAFLEIDGLFLLENAVFDGIEIAPANIRLTQTDKGDWRADIDLPSGVLQMRVNIQGNAQDNRFLATGKIIKNPDMPEAWLRWLNQNLPRTDGGWKLDQQFAKHGVVLQKQD